MRLRTTLESLHRGFMPFEDAEMYRAIWLFFWGGAFLSFWLVACASCGFWLLVRLLAQPLNQKQLEETHSRCLAQQTFSWLGAYSKVLNDMRPLRHRCPVLLFYQWNSSLVENDNTQFLNQYKVHQRKTPSKFHACNKGKKKAKHVKPMKGKGKEMNAIKVKKAMNNIVKAMQWEGWQVESNCGAQSLFGEWFLLRNLGSRPLNLEKTTLEILVQVFLMVFEVKVNFVKTNSFVFEPASIAGFNKTTNDSDSNSNSNSNCNNDDNNEKKTANYQWPTLPPKDTRQPASNNLQSPVPV